MENYRYVFSVAYTVDGPVLDTFYQLQSPYIRDPIAAKVAFKINPHLMDQDLPTIRWMLLRQRYAMTEGLFLIATEEELERDGLEMLLGIKQREGKLREFLKLAKCL